MAWRSLSALQIRCNCLDGIGARAKLFKGMTEDKPAFSQKRLAQSECCCRRAVRVGVEGDERVSQANQVADRGMDDRSV